MAAGTFLKPSGVAGLFNLAEALGLSSQPDKQDVYAIDPRTVLQPGALKQADLEKVANRFTAHKGLYKHLSKGEPELADHDEPGNEWYFGERAEIFDYKMLGEHPTKSGYTSLIYAHVLHSILKGEHPPAGQQLPSWEQFLAFTSDTTCWPHKKLPFLFAGRMVEASMAALYSLERGGRVVGLLVSSETAGGAAGDE